MRSKRSSGSGEESWLYTGHRGTSLGTRSFGPGGAPVEFKLLGLADAVEDLEQAVEKCKQQLSTYPGLFDIRDDSVPGKWEYRFELNLKRSQWV